MKLDEIGDFVLASPFLRELRRNSPRSNIILVVKPAVHNLAELCPYVDKVIVFDWTTESGFFPILSRQWRALRLACVQLRNWSFDLAVIPRWDADTYHATHLAVYSGSRAIVAYSEKCSSIKRIANRGYDRLVSHPIFPNGDCMHEVEASLAILKKYKCAVSSGALEVWLSEDDFALARNALSPDQRFVAIATGASKSYKCWPVERFASLVVWVQEKYGLIPLLFGSETDPIIIGICSFLGKSLRETAAMMARCVLFVGNDSGLKHIAAAVGTPVVEINALRANGPATHHVSPARFGAWGVAQQIVQPPPGFGDCAIEEVSLTDVQVSVEKLMVEIASSSRAAL